MATSQPQVAEEQTRIDEHVGRRCPDCRGRVVPEGVESVCQSCGLVVDANQIDHGPEWRDYDDGSNPSRCYHGNPNRDDKGLGTTLWPSQGDTPAQRRQFRYHEHARQDTGRSQRYLTNEVQRMAVTLGMPQHVNRQAQRIARQARGEGVNGWSLEAIASGGLYAACRLERLGWSAKDIEQVARCDVNRIRQAFRKVQRDLSLEVPPPDPVARVGVVAGRIGMDSQAIEQARQVVREQAGVNGSPSTLAAYALYSVGDVTQRECANAARCAPTSIRKRGREIE